MALTPFTFQETKRIFYPIVVGNTKAKCIEALHVRLFLHSSLKLIISIQVLLEKPKPFYNALNMTLGGRNAF